MCLLVKPLFLLNTAHPLAHPSSQLPSHTTVKVNSWAFYNPGELAANPYVAGRDSWPKPEDPTGTIPAPPRCFTFLLQATANEGKKIHDYKPGRQLFCKQLNERGRRTELCRAVAGIQDLPPSGSLLGFCSKSPALMDGNKLPVLLH